jgi:dTDP-4-dehydrorhamnose reductase
MSAKTSQEQQNLLQWLLERGEQGVGQVLEDVLGRPGVSDGLAKVVKRAAQTKGRMDKNAETVLHLLNLPSRADYHKLLVKIEHLQGSLVNLNMKLDRLLAAQEKSGRKRKAES